MDWVSISSFVCLYLLCLKTKSARQQNLTCNSVACTVDRLKLFLLYSLQNDGVSVVCLRMKVVSVMWLTE
jgi:hypothetical protein